MTSPQFIEWLDGKMAEHDDVGKLVPPHDVLVDEVQAKVEDIIREQITERILQEAHLDDQVAAALAERWTPVEFGDDLDECVRDALTDEPSQNWNAFWSFVYIK